MFSNIKLHQSQFWLTLKNKLDFQRILAKNDTEAEK
jgi:hypothetical protein